MYERYLPNESYLRVATACPEVTITDTRTNTERIQNVYEEAANSGVSLLLFPELSITGYTIGDLVNQDVLLENAKQSVLELARQTVDRNTAMVVGLPLQVQNRLYNCAALLADGEVKGIVPKQHLPSYGEFYDNRWFSVWDQDNANVTIGDQAIPFGTDILFEVGGVPVGLEICEDLWADTPPSNKLATQGALLIANLSASPEQIDKEEDRRDLVRVHSKRLVAGYVYASCDTSESTMDIVMGGHQLIAENGRVLAEREPFADDTESKLNICDIDIDRLRAERRRRKFANTIGGLLVQTNVERSQTDLRVQIDQNPSLPNESPEKRAARLDKIFKITAHGLAMRMKNTGQERLVLGLSGGRDSALALLVACEAAKILKKDPADMIHTLTMPGPASSERTQTNAQRIAAALGVQNELKPIHAMVAAELAALGHDGVQQDIVYENVQARARSTLLFNYGNQEHCMVLGTSDLTELILGWCTYNADQTSHYHVIGGVPKTVVSPLLEHVAPRFNLKENIAVVLQDKASPELVQEIEGVITQNTEDIIGPYELHDFYMIHNYQGERPNKIAYLAEQAFQGKYDEETVQEWLKVHYRMFHKSQFKRTTAPDAPKVISMSASKIGDMRLPTEIPTTAEHNPWMRDLV